MTQYENNYNRHLAIHYNGHNQWGDIICEECESIEECKKKLQDWLDDYMYADGLRETEVFDMYIGKIGVDDDGEDYDLETINVKLEYTWEE